MPAPSSPQLFHIHPIPVLLILTTTAVLTAPLSLLVAAIAPTPIPVEQQRPPHQIHMTRTPASALDFDASGEKNLIGSTILCFHLFAALFAATDQSFAWPQPRSISASWDLFPPIHPIQIQLSYILRFACVFSLPLFYLDFFRYFVAQSFSCRLSYLLPACFVFVVLPFIFSVAWFGFSS